MKANTPEHPAPFLRLENTDAPANTETLTKFMERTEADAEIEAAYEELIEENATLEALTSRAEELKALLGRETDVSKLLAHANELSGIYAWMEQAGIKHVD